MQKWEYLTEAVGADDLAARGSEGWELVAVADGVMFYKRQAAASAVPPEAPAIEPVLQEAESHMDEHTEEYVAEAPPVEHAA